MKPQSIVLANASRFLRDVLRRVIERTPDLRIAAEVPALGGLREAIEAADAQWVIVAYPPGERMPEAIESLLSVRPSLNVLTVAADGSHIKMRWLEEREETLDELSADDLIAILRRGHPRRR